MIRRPFTRRHLILACLLLFTLAALAQAHPGGLDQYGGHHDRQNGGYHFHRGLLAGQTFATKEEALAALAAAEHAADSLASKPAAPQSGDRVDALIRLLERKGIITEKELAAELGK